MRPLGHQAVREEREEQIVTNTPLEVAWSRISVPYPFVSSKSIIPLMEEIRPSVQQLHECVIRVYPTLDMCTRSSFGNFITAGYQRVPDRTIVYDLVTPLLDNIGANLYGKRLVIDGVVGDCTGYGMIGTLIINGTTGGYAGGEMIGKLDVRPGGHAAHSLRDDIRWFGAGKGAGAGARMVGVLVGGDAHAGVGMRGKKNGRWNISRWRRRKFIKDIAGAMHDDAQFDHQYFGTDELPERYHRIMRTRYTIREGISEYLTERFHDLYDALEKWECGR
jgi:hypothetical protein